MIIYEDWDNKYIRSYEGWDNNNDDDHYNVADYSTDDDTKPFLRFSTDENGAVTLFKILLHSCQS